MATDINQIVTVGYLQSYDRKIKAAYKNADTALETKLMDAIGKNNSFEITIVESLPLTGKIGTFYLVKADAGEYKGTDNVYKEYLWYMKKEADETAGTPAEYGWELVGDTKLDLDDLKDDIDTKCVQSVDVSSEENQLEGTEVTVTTYTVQYKNGKGEVIDTETFNAVTSIGEAVALELSDGSAVPISVGSAGLMSANDKYVLYKLEAELDDYITEAEANARYVASLDITTGDPVVTGNTSVTTVTVSSKNADGNKIDSDTFDVTTYNEATQEANGLMSAADKVKLDGLNTVTSNVDDWFDDNWPDGETL